MDTLLKMFLFTSLLFMFCCKNKQVNDEKVISDIFPQLIDSFNIKISNLIPPPPQIINDNDSNNIKIDSDTYRNATEKYNQLIKQIDSADSRLLIGIIDTCLSIDFANLGKRSFSDNLIIRKIIENNEHNNVSLAKWNLKQIKTPLSYQLILNSDLVKKYSCIRKIDDRKFGGLIAISRIYYDKENKVGLLQFEYYPFYHEGVSYFVIIERINENWKIKKTQTNWVT